MKKFVNIITVAVCALFLITASVSAGTVSAEGKSVYLGGQPFGVRFYNDGLIVVELEEFFDGTQNVCPAKKAGLKVNDIIKEVNRIPVRTNEDLQNAAVNCEGKPISFIIERDGDRKEIVITPQKNNMGVYLLGAWIRDSCAGIGTISFFDKDKNYFAALGHGICDNDTSALLPLGSAEIVKANISSVTKSVDGKAGSLNGYFGEETIGTLTENTPLGIYGEPNSGMLDSSKEIEIADYSEIEKGEAEIYTTIDGENAACYTAEITKLCNADENSNENFVIKITDKSLLDSCGGIVQGMSGSPIVQNGKLVGAITHVFINNTAEGYGIAAQFMVSNYE